MDLPLCQVYFKWDVASRQLRPATQESDVLGTAKRERFVVVVSRVFKEPLSILGNFLFEPLIVLRRVLGICGDDIANESRQVPKDSSAHSAMNPPVVHWFLHQ